MVWHLLSKKAPIAYITGCFDGEKSDKILVCTFSGKYHVVEMYEGVLDGVSFRDFYDDRDFKIDNVQFWTEIDSPF
jgi:hypothetical protein